MGGEERGIEGEGGVGEKEGGREKREAKRGGEGGRGMVSSALQYICCSSSHLSTSIFSLPTTTPSPSPWTRVPFGACGRAKLGLGSNWLPAVSK